MKFEDAIEYVLKFEGGYVDDFADRGGATNWGISYRSHPDIDTKSLTREQAIEIYRKEYWEPNKKVFEFLKYHFEASFIETKLSLFDFCVNAGAKNAFIIFQRALNALNSNLVEDGIIGKKTLNAWLEQIEIGHEYPLEIAFRCERAAYYRVLAAKDPSQEKFLKGWLARANA